MSSSTSSISSASSEQSLTSDSISALIASPPSFEIVPSASSYESESSSVSQFEIKGSSKLFDSENFVDNFPPTQVIDHRDIIQRNQGINPSSSSSKELVLYEPERHHLENQQEQLEKVVKNVVYKEVKKLLLQAKEEKKKEEQPEHDSETSMKEEGNDSMNESGKQMILRVENAQINNESPKILHTALTVTPRQSRTTTKQMAFISNVSFDITKDLIVDNDIVNEFVPHDDVVREITMQSNKKYSFVDRLRGWNMECRMRLHGDKQFDKYFTHVESRVVLRSVREIVRFILYEVNPKQIKEATRKRKAIE